MFVINQIFHLTVNRATRTKDCNPSFEQNCSNIFGMIDDVFAQRLPQAFVPPTQDRVVEMIICCSFFSIYTLRIKIRLLRWVRKTSYLPFDLKIDIH